MMEMTRRAFAGAMLALMSARSARAGVGSGAALPMKFGYTAVADYAAAFLGVDGGYFARQGLAVELVPISVNSLHPSALVSGSIQAALPSPSVFLQAVDNGLDLVALANVSNIMPNGTLTPVLARPQLNLGRAQDFVGRIVGVAGIGAFLHVLFRRYLLQQGIDPDRVTYVEVGFPNMGDALRSGSVDAVICVDPFASRILEAGTGQTVVDLRAVTPAGQTTSIVALTRAWADAHPAATRALRDAWGETSRAVLDPVNNDATRAAIGHYTRLPPAALATIAMPIQLEPHLSVSQLEWWLDTMRQQKMIETKIDPARLLWQG